MVNLPPVGSKRWFRSDDARGPEYDMSDHDGWVEVRVHLINFVGSGGHALTVRGTDAANYDVAFVAWPHELHEEAC